MRLVIILLALLPVAIAAPARAFDCGKAKTKVEKAICADPALIAADDEMSSAFVEVRASSSEKDRKMLAQSQRKWLKSRETRCDYLDGAELVDCIRTATDDRRRLLLGEAESGPGAPARIVPFFIQKDATKNTYDVDYTLLRFAEAATAGEKAFNDEVGKIAASAPLRTKEDFVPEGGTLSAVTTMAIDYASPRLISASVDSYIYSGGAHGNSGLTAINVDLEKGRVIEVSDMFEEKAMPALKAECEKQIAAQKTERLGTPFNPAEDMNYSETTVSEHLATMSAWTFTAAKAIVTFDPYAVGSYAEGSFTCEFPIAQLRATAKPGAPLPE